ncbi:MAG: hypothetical protein ACOCZ7_00985, partial [Armatimonadota bacterium]
CDWVCQNCHFHPPAVATAATAMRLGSVLSGFVLAQGNIEPPPVYQLDFRTPGILPSSAFSLKQMRQMPNFLM